MTLCFSANSSMRYPVRLKPYPESYEIQAYFSNVAVHAKLHLKILTALQGIADLHEMHNSASIPTGPFFLAKQGLRTAPLKNSFSDLMPYLNTASICRVALPIFLNAIPSFSPRILHLHSFPIIPPLNNSLFEPLSLKKLLSACYGPAFTSEWSIQNAVFIDEPTGLSCQVNTPLIERDSRAAASAMKVASFIGSQNGFSSNQPSLFGNIDFGFSPLLARSKNHTFNDSSEISSDASFYLIDRDPHYNMFQDIAIIANELASELADFLIQVRMDDYSDAIKKLHEGTYSDKLQINSEPLSIPLGKWIIPHYIHKYHQNFHELPSASKVNCYMSLDPFWEAINAPILTQDTIIHTFEQKKEFPELIPPSYLYIPPSSPTEACFKTKSSNPVKVRI